MCVRWGTESPTRLGLGRRGHGGLSQPLPTVASWCRFVQDVRQAAFVDECRSLGRYKHARGLIVLRAARV